MLEIRDENYILVASDVHDDENSFERLKAIAENPRCLAFLYAGDLNVENYFIASMLKCRNFTFIPVQGNCDNRWSWIDFALDLPLYRTCHYHNLGIFITHGHMYSDPESAGLEIGDIRLVINDHSHVNDIHSEEIDGKKVIFMNPGSPSRPRGRSKASYGIVRFLSDGSVVAETRALEGDGLLAQEAIAVH